MGGAHALLCVYIYICYISQRMIYFKTISLSSKHFYPLSHLTSPQSHILFLLNSIILHPMEPVLKNGQQCVDWQVRQPVTSFPSVVAKPTVSSSWHTWQVINPSWGVEAHDVKQIPEKGHKRNKDFQVHYMDLGFSKIWVFQRGSEIALAHQGPQTS